MPPRWPDSDDDWEDDVEDAPDENEDATAPCPHCRQPVYEDADQCPHCGQYISAEDSPATVKPWWIVVGAIACLYAVYRWIIGG